MANRKKTAEAPEEGFLTTAAQAIGSTLGQLAVKSGVVVRKKAAVKRTAAVVKKKKAPAKRK